MKTLIFFCIASVILVLSIVTINIAPIINGLVGSTIYHADGSVVSHGWWVDTCKSYNDEYKYTKKYNNDFQKQEDKEKYLKLIKEGENKCKRNNRYNNNINDNLSLTQNNQNIKKMSAYTTTYNNNKSNNNKDLNLESTFMTFNNLVSQAKELGHILIDNKDLLKNQNFEFIESEENNELFEANNINMKSEINKLNQEIKNEHKSVEELQKINSELNDKIILFNNNAKQYEKKVEELINVINQVKNNSNNNSNNNSDNISNGISNNNNILRKNSNQILEFNFFTMNESWDDYLQIYQDLQALEIKKERVSDDPRRCMRLERELMTLLGDHYIKKELESLFNKLLKKK